MTTTISNTSLLGKLGAIFFARQTGFPTAPRHAGITAAFGAWVKRRRDARELAMLSDRELADIGITRQDIPAILRRGRTF